jgi:hypothetical protein
VLLFACHLTCCFFTELLFDSRPDTVFRHTVLGHVPTWLVVLCVLHVVPSPFVRGCRCCSYCRSVSYLCGPWCWSSLRPYRLVTPLFAILLCPCPRMVAPARSSSCLCKAAEPFSFLLSWLCVSSFPSLPGRADTPALLPWSRTRPTSTSLDFEAR